MNAPFDSLPVGALTAAALGAVGIAAALAYSSSTPKGLKPLSAIPSPPGKAITGHFHVLTAPDVHRRLTEYAVRYGQIFRISLLGTAIVVVTDVATALSLCDTLPKYSLAYDAANQLGSREKQPGLFSAHQASTFSYVRKGLLPAFSTAQLGKGFPRMRAQALKLVECVKGMASKVPAGQEVNFSDQIMAAIFDAAGDVLFDVQFDALNDPEGSHALQVLLAGRREISARVTDPLRETLQTLLWFTPANTKILRDFEFLYEKVYRRILRELKSRGAPAEADQSVGACMMRLVNPKTGKAPTDLELQAQISAFLVGGMDTSLSGTQWALYDIVRQPEVLAGIERELKEAGLLKQDGKPGRPLEHGDLNKLPYFNAVLKESMRLHNLVGCTATFRVTGKAMEVHGYHLPKGTPVWLPLHSLTNSPVNFPEPTQFRPERWLGATLPDGSANAWATPHDWLPLAFSHGPRSCPGMPHGLVQLRTFLLVLLTQLKFALGPSMSNPDEVEASQVMALTMMSTKGFPYVVTPR